VFRTYIAPQLLPFSMGNFMQKKHFLQSQGKNAVCLTMVTTTTMATATA